MSNITRFDPFRELSRFDPLFDIDELFARPVLRTLARNVEMEPQIRMDVKETGDSYTVKAEIPGVSKDDIHVSIEGNLVSISAEVKKEKEEKEGERVLRCERCYGMASRSFTLDSEVDQGKAQAKYADGVLELTLPKKPGSTRKQIAVS